MTYDYASRKVWLDRAEGDSPPPGVWGLCDQHAEGLRVPVGWAREDRRSVATLHPRIAV